MIILFALFADNISITRTKLKKRKHQSIQVSQSEKNIKICLLQGSIPTTLAVVNIQHVCGTTNCCTLLENK